jgi:glyoxylase-like metal-dependent hydrolase (beta-lactamase superfamily II)
MSWNTKIVLSTLILVSIITIGTTGNAGESEIEITYLANEGVMITTGSNKVLIDALFDNPNPNYRAPSEEMLAGMQSGRAPFDDVDLVLVTHNHPDHFSPSFAARFMENNPNTLLIAAKDAVTSMKDNIKDWESVQNRVFSFDLALVHFWFPLYPHGERIILDVLKPDHVGLIHLPMRLESDAPSKIDAVKSRYKDIFLFVKQGEIKTFR